MLRGAELIFGVWRPAQLRVGPTASRPYTQPMNSAQVEPLPAASAYATAASLLDVPSGRAAGAFIVDHTARAAPPGSPNPPSCVAFESGDGMAPPLLALFTIGHGIGRSNSSVAIPPCIGRCGSGTRKWIWHPPSTDSETSTERYVVYFTLAPVSHPCWSALERHSDVRVPVAHVGLSNCSGPEQVQSKFLWPDGARSCVAAVRYNA